MKIDLSRSTIEVPNEGNMREVMPGESIYTITFDAKDEVLETDEYKAFTEALTKLFEKSQELKKSRLAQ